jgi:predicted RNA-binding Zn ribbon-like protein
MSFTQKDFEAEGFAQPYAWLDFVNSEEYDGFGRASDHLEDPSWVRVFLLHWGIAERLGKGADFRSAQNLRSFLRRAAKTIAAGKSLSRADLDTINESLRVPAYRFVRKAQNVSYVLELLPIRRDWRWTKAEILSSLADFLADGQQRRLKVCPNTGCGWVFFDKTHGNTRRWCSDLTCGNRDKVRRLRARRREGAETQRHCINSCREDDYAEGKSPEPAQQDGAHACRPRQRTARSLMRR